MPYIRPFHRLLAFVPEGDRTAKTVPVDLQDRWTLRLLRLLAGLFGGATAYGRGVRVWKHRGNLYWDRVTAIESWNDPATPGLRGRMQRLGRNLDRMRADLQQKAVGCNLDGVWTWYEERTR